MYRYVQESWPILYSKLLYKFDQDCLDTVSIPSVSLFHFHFPSRSFLQIFHSYLYYLLPLFSGPRPGRGAEDWRQVQQRGRGARNLDRQEQCCRQYQLEFWIHVKIWMPIWTIPRKQGQTANRSDVINWLRKRKTDKNTIKQTEKYTDNQTNNTDGNTYRQEKEGGNLQIRHIYDSVIYENDI